MSTLLAGKVGAAPVAETKVRQLPAFAWSARDEDAEKLCEREVARAMSWRSRLLGWLIEYNKY